MIKAILKANPDILLKFGPNGMKFVSSLLKQPGNNSTRIRFCVHYGLIHESVF